MAGEEDSITTIKLRASTRDRLMSKGRKNESYDDLINRLLDEREKKEE